ncbi:MAG: hypothetical protein ACLTDR_02670 [Adlercreutzia equolifaciens]
MVSRPNRTRYRAAAPVDRRCAPQGRFYGVLRRCAAVRGKRHPRLRGADGLRAQRCPYPPETMVSRSCYDAHPASSPNFYCDRIAGPERAEARRCPIRKPAEAGARGALSARP